jgi:hypothetical protein
MGIRRVESGEASDASRGCCWGVVRVLPLTDGVSVDVDNADVMDRS